MRDRKLIGARSSQPPIPKAKSGHFGEAGSRSFPLRRWTLLLAPFAAAALVVVGEGYFSRDAPMTLAASFGPERLVPTAFGPQDHAAALYRAESALALASERVAHAPGEWLPHETLAAALTRQFSLNGDYAALAAAGDALDDARALAPAASGPWLREAMVAMMRHDLAAAKTALAGFDAVAVPATRADRAEALAIRGDIAFYTGDMTTAAMRYEEAEGLSAGSALYRLAILAQARGQFDEAIAHYAATLRTGDATRADLARVALRVGSIEIARGRFEQGAAWFAAANRLYPGQPIAILMQAEADAIAGKPQAAMRAMEVVATNHALPSAMDALAMLHRNAGDAASAERWAQRSAAIWDRRLEQVPLAALAHAAEHELVFGDPQRALELARRNLASRPYGEAHLLMANALLRLSQPKAALDHLRAAEQQGWRSAPLFRAKAEAEIMLGNIRQAQEAREAAIAINPRAYDAESGRIWFSHG